MQNCLLTGASGLLGREVAALFAGSFDVIPVVHHIAVEGGRYADLRDQQNVRQLLEDVRPDLVIHTAAYREPDVCEQHPEETRRLNVEPVRTFSEWLPSSARLVFISTDYVFDGQLPPYREGDETCPVNVYGQSKVEGEVLALQHDGGLVLRIPLLVGAGPTLDESGFIAQMRQTVLEAKPLELDSVLMRYPTWTRDVARVLLFLINGKATGVFHYSALRGGTRYGLTTELAEILGKSAAHLVPSTRVVSRIAARPPDSHLLSDKLRAMGYDGFTDFADVVKSVVSTFE